FDINVFAPLTFDYARRETLPPPAVFHPSKLNTDQWVASAKNAGATYAVLVAKHGTGFCLWPTRAHGYHVGNTPWRGGKGDIVRDFIRSCRAYGVRPGLYYNTNLNTYLGALPEGIKGAVDQKWYARKVLDQLTELWSGYGSLSEIWFDGGVVADSCGGIAGSVTALINRYQPHAVLFQGPPGCRNLIRWIGNEDGRAPYPNWSRADLAVSPRGVFDVTRVEGDPEGSTWCPAEADFPGRRQSAWNGGWLWKSGEDSLVFTPADLMERYYASVGHNANMLIGVAIDTSGLVPATDSAALAGFGKSLRSVFSRPLARTEGPGTDLRLVLGTRPRRTDMIAIGEDIARGERIRRFEVQALLAGAWVTITKGSSIGHRYIGRFAPVETTSLRLWVTASDGVPAVKDFSAYRTH
ncbi:MAG TPA: alpha-L-fucosidase, partial [Bacteroidota bacterium]|nr:alpha-L-fucosidase [Bacteroidota bacterium]